MWRPEALPAKFLPSRGRGGQFVDERVVNGRFRLHLKTTVWDEKSSPDIANAALAEAMIAEETGDIAAAVSAWDVFEKAYAHPVVQAQIANVTCWAAITYEKAGQPAKADAALAAVGAIDHPDCFRFQADLLDLRGDWTGANIWYEKSIKRAVLYPASYYSWRLALARHKDLKGAEEQFQQAHAKGLRWADPLKTWGDVLELQGKTSEALTKYHEALKYAPNWKQLKEAHEVMAKHKG